MQLQGKASEANFDIENGGQAKNDANHSNQANDLPVWVMIILSIFITITAFHLLGNVQYYFIVKAWLATYYEITKIGGSVLILGYVLTRIFFAIDLEAQKEEVKKKKEDLIQELKLARKSSQKKVEKRFTHSKSYSSEKKIEFQDQKQTKNFFWKGLSNITFVIKQIDLKDEFVHLVLFSFLYLLLHYEIKIPSFFHYNTQTIQKFKAASAEFVYKTIFGLLMVIRVINKFNASFVVKKVQAREKLQLIRWTTQYSALLGLFVIELIFVEILLTNENWAQRAFLSFLEI